VERGVPRQPDRGKRMPSFLGRKPCCAFWQPAFFLAGNPMTTIAFEEEVPLKAYKLTLANACTRKRC